MKTSREKLALLQLWFRCRQCFLDLPRCTQTPLEGSAVARNILHVVLCITPALSSANPRLCWVHASVKKGYVLFPKREPNPQTRVLPSGRRCHCRLSIVQGQGSGQLFCHCRFLESVLHTLAGLLPFSGSLHYLIKTFQGLLSQYLNGPLHLTTLCSAVI